MTKNIVNDQGIPNGQPSRPIDVNNKKAATMTNEKGINIRGICARAVSFEKECNRCGRLLNICQHGNDQICTIPAMQPLITSPSNGYIHGIVLRHGKHALKIKIYVIEVVNAKNINKSISCSILTFIVLIVNHKKKD
jgi:hypothetical protein